MTSPLSQPPAEGDEALLRAHGIRPTANRIMVVRALRDSKGPMSLRELEDALVTVDKSSISRVLSLFREHQLLHTVEDGEGSLRYELCMRHSEDSDDDEHIHFHCVACGRTFCLPDSPVPAVALPDGYVVMSANYLIRGLCPACAARKGLRRCDGHSCGEE